MQLGDEQLPVQLSEGSLIIGPLMVVDFVTRPASGAASAGAALGVVLGGGGRVPRVGCKDAHPHPKW